MVRWRRIKRAVRRRARRATAQLPPRASGTKRREEDPRVQRRLWQTLVCGGVFVLLIALKLIMPGDLAGVRGTLGQWLVRDADFVAAFHSIGQAVGGAKDIAESLGEAYTAVFGAADEAQEVAKSVPLTQEQQLTEETAAEQRVLTFSYQPPLTGQITSSFGRRSDSNTAAETFHYGIDIAGESGKDIVAFADGTVCVVGESTALGKYLTIQHKDGFETLYGHCSRITATSGQSVTAGEKIAEVGQTGNATGPHLHFELHQDTTFLDPAYYLDP